MNTSKPSKMWNKCVHACRGPGGIGWPQASNAKRCHTRLFYRVVIAGTGDGPTARAETGEGDGTCTCAPRCPPRPACRRQRPCRWVWVVDDEGEDARTACCLGRFELNWNRWKSWRAEIAKGHSRADGGPQKSSDRQRRLTTKKNLLQVWKTGTFVCIDAF